MADTDVDGLADALWKRFRKAQQSTDDDDDAPNGTGKVPYSRFQAKAAEAKALKAELAELAEEVKTLQAGYSTKAETMAKQHAEALKEAQKAAAEQVSGIARQHAEDLELVDVGLRDKLGRKAVRDAYGMLPEKDRPESVVDWMKQTVEQINARNAYLAGEDADPEQAPPLPTLPTTVRGYFADKMQAPEVAKPAPAAKPGAKAPNVDRNTRRGPPPSALDMEPDANTGWAEFASALAAAEQSAG